MNKFEIKTLKAEYGEKKLELMNLEADLWILLTEMSQGDIAKLSYEDQLWREYFIKERKNQPLFQQLTKMRDPSYEPPSLIQDGFFHPDITAQLTPKFSGQELLEQLLTDSIEGIECYFDCSHCKKPIKKQDYDNHILEHHPETEAAERLRSKKKKNKT